MPTPSRSVAPIPLMTRVRVGRAMSATLLATVLAGGVIGTVLNRDDLPFPLPVLWVLIAVLTGLLAAAAFGPWHRRFGARRQEAVLTAIVGVPGAVALAVHLTSPPDDVDALLFTAALFAASALMVPLRRHLTGLAVEVLVVLAAVPLRGISPSTVFALVIVTTVATMSALGARAVTEAITTSHRREQEAANASRALMAVVDAARTATTADERDVLETVVGATAQLQSDTAGLYLLGADGQLRCGATYRIPDHLVDERFPADEGIAGLALQRDETVVTNDYQQLHQGMHEYRSGGLRAAMASPIRMDREVVGVLVAGRYDDAPYDDAAVTAFQLLADHAGRALALSRAIDEDRRTLDQLRSLRALQEDFVATISHELRTPLTMIDGLAETLDRLQDELTRERRQDMLSRLRSNTTALKTIVTSLLDTARLDRGLLELDSSVVELQPLVEGCVRRLQPLLASHDVQLDLDDVAVRGDEALLERVVDNLLTNVERHTPPGTTVGVATDVGDDRCVVVVSDDGPGIAPGDLAVITERFTRGGDHHTRGTRGLGLGLALADQVLRMHGSRLHVSSEPGQGATFRFTLPLAAATGDTAAGA